MMFKQNLFFTVKVPGEPELWRWPALRDLHEGEGCDKLFWHESGETKHESSETKHESGETKHEIQADMKVEKRKMKVQKRNMKVEKRNMKVEKRNLKVEKRNMKVESRKSNNLKRSSNDVKNVFSATLFSYSLIKDLFQRYIFFLKLFYLFFQNL